MNKLTCNSQWKPNGSSLWGLEFKITNSCESRDQHRKTPQPRSFTACRRLLPVSLFLQKFKGTFYLQIKSKYTHSHIIRCTCSIARSINYLISQSHGTDSVVKMTSWSWAEHQNEEGRWCKWCWTWLAYLPLNISETDDSNEFYLYSDKSQQPVPQSKDPTFTQYRKHQQSCDTKISKVYGGRSSTHRSKRAARLLWADRKETII